MSSHVDVEEIQTTRSEKLLAVVLAIFLLIGGIWSYEKIDDAVRDERPPAAGSPADREAVERLERADRRVFAARQREARARAELEFRREAYRTALDARRPAAGLERRYRAAERELGRAQASLRRARAEARDARPAAAAASRRIEAEYERRSDRDALLAFVLRLALVVGSIAIAYWLLGSMRRRGSRYFPVALAAVGYSAVLAVVLSGDYVTDYVDPLELGPLVLSLFGVAITLAAFVALQRYLARRLPFRRVRKGECPFCGYPARRNEHCEGCGRELVLPCGACAQPRRVGTLHCGACGAG